MYCAVKSESKKPCVLCWQRIPGRGSKCKQSPTMAISYQRQMQSFSQTGKCWKRLFWRVAWLCSLLLKSFVLIQVSLRLLLIKMVMLCNMQMTCQMREVVKVACAQNGYTLQYASEELRSDKEVVMLAVSQVPYAFEYASDTLRNDASWCLHCENCGWEEGNVSGVCLWGVAKRAGECEESSRQQLQRLALCVWRAPSRSRATASSQECRRAECARLGMPHGNGKFFFDIVQKVKLKLSGGEEKKWLQHGVSTFVRCLPLAVFKL